MLALALALTASAFWGVADFIGGVKARQLALVQVILVGEGVGLAVAVAVVAASGDGPPRGSVGSRAWLRSTVRSRSGR